MTEQQSTKSDSVNTSLRLSRWPLILYGLGFALLGLSAGIFAGLSYSPVIGVLLPLLFGLIGGVNGFYMYRVDFNNNVDRYRLKIVGLMLSVFMIFILMGSLYGLLVRTRSGLSEFVPRLHPQEEATESSIVISDLDTLDTGTALELELLRYRLQALGTNNEEQKVILASARKSLEASIDQERITREFDRLLTLCNEIFTDVKTILDADPDYSDPVGRPDALENISEFLELRSYQYQYLVQELPHRRVAIKDLIDFIDEDRADFSRLIRGDIYYDIDYHLELWLIDHPEFHKKLWDLELAYLETAYELRDPDWLSGQPLTEDIDQLIQASNAQVSPSAESDLASEARNQGPGFLP